VTACESADCRVTAGVLTVLTVYFTLTPASSCLRCTVFTLVMDTALAGTLSVYATVAANDDAKDVLCAVARSTPLTVCVTAIITATATVGVNVGAPGTTEGRNVGS